MSAQSTINNVLASLSENSLQRLRVDEIKQKVAVFDRQIKSRVSNTNTQTVLQEVLQTEERILSNFDDQYMKVVNITGGKTRLVKT